MITDRYYRGYRLSIHNEGQADMTVNIFYGTEWIQSTHAICTAKALIDVWQVAP